MTQLVVLMVPSFTVKPPEILTVNTGENFRLSESGSREEPDYSATLATLGEPTNIHFPTTHV